MTSVISNGKIYGSNNVILLTYLLSTSTFKSGDRVASPEVRVKQKPMYGAFFHMQCSYVKSA